MSDPGGQLLRHGELALFVSILLEELGLPLPAVPILLAAGALAGSGKLGGAPLLAAATAASLLADLFWYWLGRLRGGEILKLLCRISLEPDSCVGAAKTVFERTRSRGLIAAKFVPALGNVMPPLAGMFGVGVPEFLLFDGVGSLLYVGLYGALGYCFSDQLGRLSGAAERLGSASALLVAAGFAGYALWKWFRRRQFLRRLEMARITADELRAMRDAGQEVLVFDIRSALDLKTMPHAVPGARWIPKDDFRKRHQEIPRDREVVIYCACPNEASAAEMALLLHKHGVERVRPLLGGVEAWMERGFATEAAMDPGGPAPDAFES